MMLKKKIFFIINLFFFINCQNNNINNNINYHYQQEKHQNQKSKLNKRIYKEFLNKYNLLVNYHENYQKQLTNCQTLINEIEQTIKKTNDNKIINDYQHLIKKTINKQKWLINNHLGINYHLISIITFVFNVITLFLVVLITNLFLTNNNLQAFKKEDFDNIFHKNENLSKNDYKSIIFFFILCYVIPTFSFFLSFFFDRLTPFWDHLINDIHSLFTKYSFNNNYSLPKHQASYFYYDHSTKVIINHEKYFIITFLFTNNNHLATNIFDFVVNVIIFLNYFFTIYISLKKNINLFVTNIWVRFFLFFSILIKLLTIINIIFVHYSGNNIVINLFKGSLLTKILSIISYLIIVIGFSSLITFLTIHYGKVNYSWKFFYDEKQKNDTNTKNKNDHLNDEPLLLNLSY